MKTKEDFQIWLDVMEERILELKELLPREIAAKLDFSIESLQTLEDYLLERYESNEQIMMESEANMILDRLGRYFGEVVRKNVDECTWTVFLDDKRNIYYRLPILSILNPNYFNDCPIYDITTAIGRRTGNFLTRKVGIYIKYVEERRDSVPHFNNEYAMPVYL